MEDQKSKANADFNQINKLFGELSRLREEQKVTKDPRSTTFTNPRNKCTNIKLQLAPSLDWPAVWDSWVWPKFTCSEIKCEKETKCSLHTRSSLKCSKTTNNFTKPLTIKTIPSKDSSLILTGSRRRSQSIGVLGNQEEVVRLLNKYHFGWRKSLWLPLHQLCKLVKKNLILRLRSLVVKESPRLYPARLVSWESSRSFVHRIVNTLLLAHQLVLSFHF